jgi:hypothetical protein
MPISMRQVAILCGLSENESNIAKSLAESIEHYQHLPDFSEQKRDYWKTTLRPFLAGILPNPTPLVPFNETWNLLYRAIYKYLLNRSDLVNISSKFVFDLASHLEGCLVCLTRATHTATPKRPKFGDRVKALRNSSIIGTDLAEQLFAFNKVALIPIKHAEEAIRQGVQDPDEPSYAPIDMCLALMCTRILSIQLFQLLSEHGVKPPHEWPLLTE